MRTADGFRFAAEALLRHRRRTVLSLLGVAIGVTAVVVLTGLGEGARRYVTGEFRALGSHLLAILPGRTETTGGIPGFGGVPHDLTLDDAAAIERALPRAVRVVPIAVGTETVRSPARSRSTLLIGSTAGYADVRDLSIASGSFLPDDDPKRGAPVCVLGAKVRRELFGADDPVGKVVRIGSWRMRVIGVLAEKGVQIGVDLDDLAIVPVETAMRMLNRSSLFRILVDLPGPAALARAEETVLALLTERHGEEDVTCITEESVVQSLSVILGVLTVALSAIAAISLVVAGVGIMNVMLVSVAERTSEIGLLMALGARRSDVARLFLTEAVLLALVGGLLGLAIGVAALAAVRAALPGFPAGAPAWAAAAALAVSIGTGIASGLLPAWRASRLDPVLALERAT